MEKWRRFFLSANTDIFEVIKNAIILAATDSPKDFKLRRVQIAELLFSCKVTKCLRCEEIGLAVPEEEEDEKCNTEMDARDHFSEDDRTNKNKVNSMMDDEDDGNDDDDHSEGNDVEADLNRHHISYGEIEALTDEIEEESQMFTEVLRIKGILENSKDESNSVLYNSLRRLELMDLSVEILKATEIGKSVKVLVKHGSDQIKRLAGTLLKYWVDKVDQWLNAPAITNVSEGTPESMKKSDVVDEDDEEGLPSPPLDEGVFFLTETAPIEWGEFFDDMDDNGNPRNSDNIRKQSNLDKRKQQISHELVKPSIVKKELLAVQRRLVKPTQIHRESLTTSTDRTSQQHQKQATVVKLNKPTLGESGPGRPTTKPGVEQYSSFEFKTQKKPDRIALQKKESISSQQNLKNSEEVAELKLEAAKRKLQERYQEAQNAKKQRTVQVMELRDIPKQDQGQRNQHMKAGNNNGRFRANGHR